MKSSAFSPTRSCSASCKTAAKSKSTKRTAGWFFPTAPPTLQRCHRRRIRIRDSPLLQFRMEHWIVALFLFFFSIEILVEFVINELNLRYVRARWAEKNISDIFRGRLGAEEYDKSVAYTLAKGRFQRWAAIY